jgi:hypothetical protein
MHRKKEPHHPRIPVYHWGSGSFVFTFPVWYLEVLEIMEDKWSLDLKTSRLL